MIKLQKHNDVKAKLVCHIPDVKFGSVCFEITGKVISIVNLGADIVNRVHRVTRYKLMSITKGHK